MKLKLHTIAVVAGALSMTAIATTAEAGRFFERSGGFATGGGHTGRWSSRVERSRGSMSREGAVTTDRGRTLTRSGNRQYDRETGTVYGSATGIRGNTRTSEGTYDRGTGVYQREITGSGGKTVTGTSTYDWRSRTRESTYTGEGGRTASAVSNRNENAGRTATLTGAQGGEYTRSTANSYDRATSTLTHSVTSPKGTTRSVDLFPE